MKSSSYSPIYYTNIIIGILNENLQTNLMLVLSTETVTSYGPILFELTITVYGYVL
jgi:hypothetical protein